MMYKKINIIILTLFIPILSFAKNDEYLTSIDINVVNNIFSIIALIVFIIAYLLVMTEEFTKLNKSKPMIIAAGIIWILVAITAKSMNVIDILQNNFSNVIIEYCELMIFLLVAMTYINIIEDYNVFAKIKNLLLNAGFGYLSIFWITGILSFFLSSIADNLTTALIMSTVIISLGKDNKKFITMSCVNIVVASNAGGAFSPFGDITTLMVWQKGIIKFTEFFSIFIPSFINFLIPAIIMSFFIPKTKIKTVFENKIIIKEGAILVILLFIMTIITAILFEHVFHLPPSLGMMTGLGYVMIYYYISDFKKNKLVNNNLSIFDKVKEIEWDTLLFFYGILISVQGLATLGYLGIISKYLYCDMNSIAPNLFSPHTQANTIIGIFSAIIDNIPVMFAVLSMNPTIDHFQWLLITLTAGTGGSLLSIGSAAGIAVMGKSKGKYTFNGHLKWTWVIAIGYFSSIVVHFLINN